MKTWGNTEIGLQLDLTGGNLISGGLTNASWVALLSAYREMFSKTNPAPQAGKYTLILPGTNSEALPGGNGYGAVTVSSNGSVALNGTLGDGTVVTPTANENENGLWPVYAPVYGGSGMLLGWLSFTNEADRDIDGVVNWYKPAQPKSALYKAGFTNEIEVIGSAYSFKSGERALDLTNGYVLLQDGGLPEAISNQFTILPDNIVEGSNKTQLTLTTSSGLFKGSVTNGTAKPYSFSGAVLQKQTNGFGLFLNGEQSGGVFIGSQ